MSLSDQPDRKNLITAGETIYPDALEGRHEAWKFCLFIAGSAPNSELAQANLQQICEIIQQELPECSCSLEIVDILKEPQRALSEGILVTPTLLKLAPAPVCKLIGSLSEREQVLLALGLEDAGQVDQVSEPSSTKSAPQEAYIKDLERRLAEAEANIRALIAAQIDAVLEQSNTTPLLLREAQAALQRSKEELEARVAERTAELQRAKDELEARVIERTQELIRKNNELEVEITERERIQAELAEVQSRLIDSTEAERLQLAQELHDGPMQDLYGLVYQLEALGKEQPAEERDQAIHSIREKLEQVIRSLRIRAIELRPPTLASFGLEKAIRSHCEQLKITHLELQFDLHLEPDRQSIPERMRLALFRVYQVALTNVIRHAQASRVVIRLMLDTDTVILEIEDDGCGFEVPERWIDLARQGHLGLVGATERAEAVGGKMEVKSKPGKGTLIRVVVPHQSNG